MSERLSSISPVDLALDSDTETLCEVLLRANVASMSYNGYPTWPFTDIALEHLERDIHSGEVYCLRGADDSPYAAVSINLEDKKNLWPIDQKQTPAVYFSKLMKDPAVDASGVIYALFEQIVAIAKTHGLDTVRCDAVASNQELLAYYFKLGFVSKGQAPYPYPGDTRQAELLEASCDQLEALVSS